jgi:alkanesulfonate monooxygenase SsuD/methylene tetrahydromethanopterin reductase-like flavin-dependent oxidoreductase (luciferase family)
MTVSPNGSIDRPASGIRVGTAIPAITGRPLAAAERREALIDIADAGLDHVMFGDHVSFHGGFGMDGLVQAAASLGCRPDLGVYVGLYLLPLRHPVPVARQLSDLADLAPGKLTLGVGIGGEDRHEVAVCGVDPATRGKRMDEALTVLRKLVAGDRVTLHGAHIDVDDALVRPIPTKPLPLIVGGRSQAALDRAARLGDGWLGIWTSSTRFAAATASIAALSAEVGRETAALTHGLNVWCGLAVNRNRARAAVADAMQAVYRLPYEKFERYSPFGSAAEVADFLAPYVDAGCTTFNLIPCGDDLDTVITMATEIQQQLTGDRHRDHADVDGLPAGHFVDVSARGGGGGRAG